MDCLKPMTRAPTRAEIDIFLQDCDSFVILVNTLRGTTLSDVAINLTICFRAIHKLTYVQPACGVAYINLTIFVALFVALLLMFSVGFAFPVVYSPELKKMCRPVGANFSWPVLIFGKGTRKTVPLCPLLISLIP